MMMTRVRYKDMYRERVERQYKTVSPRRHTAHVTCHTSLLTPHTPHLTPHTSHLTQVNPQATPQQVNEVLEGDGSAIFATMSVCPHRFTTPFRFCFFSYTL